MYKIIAESIDFYGAELWEVRERNKYRINAENELQRMESRSDRPIGKNDKLIQSYKANIRKEVTNQVMRMDTTHQNENRKLEQNGKLAL